LRRDFHPELRKNKRLEQFDDLDAEALHATPMPPIVPAATACQLDSWRRCR
jgi:hypothetical protein